MNKSPTAQSKIESLLSKQPQKWLSTGEIAESLPDVTRSMLYVTISNLTTKVNRLVRRKRTGGAGYEYQISPSIMPKSIQPDQVNQHQSQIPTNPAMKLSFVNALAKIIWTDEEKMQFARSFLKARKERQWISTADAIREAQKSFPSTRQRKTLTKRQDIPWLSDYLQRAKDEEELQARKDQELKDLEKNQQSVPEAPVIAEAPASAPIDAIPQFLPTAEAPKVIEIPLELGSLATSALMDEIVKRTTAALTKIVIDVFSSPQVREAMSMKVNVNINHRNAEVPDRRQDDSKTTVAPRHEPQVPAPSRPRLKKILVVGLINSQIREIEKEFNGTLDVRFWKTDEHTNVLKSKAGQADHVILVTDFISHSHQSVLQNMGIKFIRHSGGITKLKDVLTEIYVKESDAK